MARQFHRPARLDPEAAEQIEGSADTAVASELAHRAAQALVGGFPTTPDDPITREGVIAVVAGQGVDDVAELWADSPATTLPGALWRLFLVREWIRRDPALVERRYATVVDLTGPDDDGALASRLDAALAQGRPAIAPEELRERLDSALAGALEGSVPALAPLLATTSSFLGALAAGSAPQWIDDDADPLADRVTRRDSALLATADELADAAARAQAGLLD